MKTQTIAVGSRIGNGRANQPKPTAKANILGLPAPKPEAVKAPKSNSAVTFELDTDTNEIVARIKLADEAKLSESGKSYIVANMPYATTDTGIDIGDGRTLTYGRGAFYVKV